MKKVLLLLLIVCAALAAHAQTNTTVVATLSLTGQTGDGNDNILFTPTTTGDFRVSVYMVGSNSSKEVTGSVVWQDENNQQTDTTTQLQSGDNFTFSTVDIHDESGLAIQFQACVGTAGCVGTTMTGSYDAFVVVEQLF